MSFISSFLWTDIQTIGLISDNLEIAQQYGLWNIPFESFFLVQISDKLESTQQYGL